MEPLFTAYDARFASMPAAEGDAKGSPQWFSWESGPVHMIQLNSFASYTAGSDQYKWLQRDLASIDNVKTPWVFVQLHVRFHPARQRAAQRPSTDTPPPMHGARPPTISQHTQAPWYNSNKQ